MPVAIGPIIASISASAALSVTVGSAFVYSLTYTALTGLVYVGASLGLSYLSSLFFKPKTPTPEDVQTQTRNATAPRQRHYGRVKVSGNWTFADSTQGNFHKVLSIGQGPINAVEEFWVDDYQVTENPSDGRIHEGVTMGGKNIDYEGNVRILYRLGHSDENPYVELGEAFPEWTNAHKGNGVVSLYATQFAVDQSVYMRMFPNGINTNYRLVIRGAYVENPITTTIEWNDAAAAVIRDYLYHPEGLRLPKAILTTPLAQAGWETAYRKSIAPIALKSGGTEPRYRLWGSYNFEERCADVLNRMLLSCDGRLMITPDAGLTLDIGDIPENPVVIDSSMIVGFSELGRGRDIMTTANVVRATFLNPNDDYQSSDADPWVDADDVDVRGEIVASYDFIMSPSHSQTRRLMKLAAYRSNPSWVGTFQCNIKALKAFGERYVKFVLPEFGINETFEVSDFRFELGDYDIVKNLTFQVSSLPPVAYQWDAEQEEGSAPESESSGGSTVIPIPDDFNVILKRKEINGQQYPYAYLTFDPPPSAALIVEAQGKLTGDTTWTPIAVSEGASNADSFLLVDGGQYEFQVRYRSLTAGEWTPSIVIAAIADPEPPDVISALVVTPATSAVNASWQSPNSSNFAATNIYRNTINNFDTATLVQTEYGAANFPFIWQDSPLTTGAYYYWFKARNFSGVESDAVASGVIVVT